MASPGEITFDDTQWPLLIITHPKEPVNKQHTLEYLDRLDFYFSKREKFIVIFNVSIFKPPTAEHRFLSATWIKANKHKIQPYFLGTACVMPHLIQRLAFVSFLRFMDITEIVNPAEVFASMDKALTWAKERLKSELIVSKD